MEKLKKRLTEVNTDNEGNMRSEKRSEKKLSNMAKNETL